MTKIRKWRFPILIGSGLIAAGALVYFSSGRLSTDKTQGAIGQREVYRDGQVNSADVATPGSAPVATEAILESSEFKALAKNAAFQELMKGSDFNELMKEGALTRLLANTDFRTMAQHQRFEAIFRSVAFRTAVRTHSDLFTALKSEMYKMDTHTAGTHLETNTLGLADSNLHTLLKTDLFVKLASDAAFNRLMSTHAFAQTLRDQAFEKLASEAAFQKALESGSAARMAQGLHRE